jgi:hypothetical protein
MKIVVSALPIALFITYINLMYHSVIISTITNNFLDFIFGFNPVNVYAPMITFLVVALVLSATSFVLIKKVVIKEK